MSRPGRALGLLLVSGLLVSACGLHTPSGVRVDQRSVDTSADEPDIRKLPPGPAPGANPAQIVNGFLQASAADPDHSFGLEFLANGSGWNDRDSATIYDPESVTPLMTVTHGAVSIVKFSADATGAIGSGGAFVPEQRLLNLTFELRRVAGQWRLTHVPDGVLLTDRDLSRSYRPVRIYGFSPDGSVLVAEPGYVDADRAGLASAALHALLTGWGNIAAAVGGGLPPGLISLGSVVVSDGEATVDLGRQAFTVPQDRRARLVAQIAATLASVPGVITVRVLVEERQYAGGPVDAQIPGRYAANSVGPVLATGSLGQLVSIDGSRSRSVKWRGTDPGVLIDPISAPGGRRMAALRPTALGYELVLADLTQDSSGVVTAEVRHSGGLVAPAGASYLRPQWIDPASLLVVVGGGEPKVQVVDAASGSARAVSAPSLRGLGPLRAFVVSRDGTRVLAVSGTPGARALFLGRITTSGTQPDGTDRLTVGGWTQVPTADADVDAVAWAGDLAITVLGVAAKSASAPGGGLSVQDISLDGVPDLTVEPTLPPDFAAQSAIPGVALSITSAPGLSDLIGVGSSTLALQDDRWVTLGTWRAPAYP